MPPHPPHLPPGAPHELIEFREQFQARITPLEAAVKTYEAAAEAYGALILPLPGKRGKRGKKSAPRAGSYGGYAERLQAAVALQVARSAAIRARDALARWLADWIAAHDGSVVATQARNVLENGQPSKAPHGSHGPLAPIPPLPKPFAAALMRDLAASAQVQARKPHDPPGPERPEGGRNQWTS